MKIEPENPYKQNDLRWHLYTQVEAKRNLMLSYSADVERANTRLNAALQDFNAANAQYQLMKDIAPCESAKPTSDTKTAAAGSDTSRPDIKSASKPTSEKKIGH